MMRLTCLDPPVSPLLKMYLVAAANLNLHNWWPGESPWMIAVTSVLVQHCPWPRAWSTAQAMAAAGLTTPLAVAKAPFTLHTILATYGHLRRKLQTLVELAPVFAKLEQNNGTLPPRTIMAELMTVPGIGPETAAAITLYAFARPVIIVDTYTMRILRRHGYLPPADAGPVEAAVRRFIAGHFPPQVELLRRLHGAFVEIGKRWCRPARPRCERCPWRFDLTRISSPGS